MCFDWVFLFVLFVVISCIKFLWFLDVKGILLCVVSVKNGISNKVFCYIKGYFFRLFVFGFRGKWKIDLI